MERVLTYWKTHHSPSMHAIYRANFGTLSTCAIFRIPRRHQPAHNRLSVHILKFRHTTTLFSTCRPQLQNKSYFTPENTASQKNNPASSSLHRAFAIWRFSTKSCPCARQHDENKMVIKPLSRGETLFVYIPYPIQPKQLFLCNPIPQASTYSPALNIVRKALAFSQESAQLSPAYIEETLTHTTTSFFTNLNLSRLWGQKFQPVVTVLSWKGTQHPLRNPLQCSGEPQGEHTHSDT